MATKRQKRLRLWMEEHGITVKQLAKDLGVAVRMARQYLSAETIPTIRHTQFTVLGFPLDLLPQPLDKKPGPKPLTPDYPGLREKSQPTQSATV